MGRTETEERQNEKGGFMNKGSMLTEDKQFQTVCPISEIPSGEMKAFSMHRVEFLIHNRGGKFKALYNKCPHMGASLADGTVDESGYITCPLHGWQFDSETGNGPPGFRDSVPTLEVKADNGDLLINESQILTLAQNNDYIVKAPPGTKERFDRVHDFFEGEMDGIQGRAKWNASSIQAMRTMKKVPGFENILFKAAQLHRLPLLADEQVNLKTVIGPNAKRPVEISLPVYVSHMSFGALGREAKIALAQGTAEVGTIMCSGEGGSHPDEAKFAGKYIYEIGTACFTRKEEWIARADAIEIKIGQAAKPGLGGHLPKEKITEEIASLRNIPRGKDQISPARFPDINNPEDLKAFVTMLRGKTDGKPIGIKFAAGHVEQDLDVALYADPDFITIDGRGGGTGAAPSFIKDNFAMPIIYALPRARKHIDRSGKKVTLIATGGFRTSGEIAKALAMGADTIAIATAAMIAIGCQQYRACQTGNCPVGIATQKQNLRDRFNIPESKDRLIRFFGSLRHELTEITQAIGKTDVSELNYGDIFTTDSEISNNTQVEHA